MGLIYASTFGIVSSYIFQPVLLQKGKGKMHSCTGTEALYRPYSP